jgi:hypothetical protein
VRTILVFCLVAQRSSVFLASLRFVYQRDFYASIKKDDAGKNNYILGLLRIG